MGRRQVGIEHWCEHSESENRSNPTKNGPNPTLGPKIKQVQDLNGHKPHIQQ